MHFKILNIGLILLQSSSGGGKFSYVIIIGIIIFIAYKLANMEDDTFVTDGQTNKVVNIPLTGGIMGLLSVSPQKLLNNRIRKENLNGWKVVQIIPSNSGNVFLAIFRFILLVLTLFIYTTENGYYVIMEKRDNKNGKKASPDKNPHDKINDFAEDEDLTIEDNIDFISQDEGIEFTDEEQEQINLFINNHYKPGEKLVFNNKNRKIQKIDETEWASMNHSEWIIIKEA